MAAGDADPAPPPSRPDRDYLFAGFAALLVVFVGMTLRGGVAAGAVAPAVGSLALLFRWTSMPVVFLLLLSYLLVYPFGLPYYTAGVNETVGSRFRTQDVLLVAAVLIYLSAQYRLLGLTDSLMPADPPARRARRPLAAAADGEFPQMMLAVAGFVLAGQVAWLGLTSLTLELDEFPPVKLGRPNPWLDEPYAPPGWLTRGLLLGGTAALGGFAARFGFWYWRLARMTRDEARMTLLDAGWRETRRELNRQEKWRAWGRARAARKAKGGAG